MESMQKRWSGNHANKTGAMFLRIDSELGLTFSGIALEAGKNAEKRRRTTEVARKAYDTITRLRERILLTGAEQDNLDANLKRLKSELQTLGEKF
jgi:hypothetical protein